jgi:multimeric flavodoxin WrbA
LKILAIVGSYRKGGIIDTAVDEILSAAGEEGAETEKIYLIDQHIAFCTNCRTCTQQAGLERGDCIHDDAMRGILAKVARADSLVLGSPMNFGTVTAVMKRFIERLVCFAHWSWGMGAPRVRNRHKAKRAVLVAASAAPALLARLSSRMVKLLRDAAGLLGAETVGVLFIGLAARQPKQTIGPRARKKARRLGKRLADARRAA